MTSRAKLAGIAAHSGMEKVFTLLGADVFRVVEVRHIEGLATLPARPTRCDVASGVRTLSQRLADCCDLPELLDALMDGLVQQLRIDHALFWLLDDDRRSLALLASCGYAFSGVGAELPVDDSGLIGVALREGVPIRIGHMALMCR